MRWPREWCCLVSLGVVLGAAGCGSSGFEEGGTDSQTMSFLAFSGHGIDQQDIVGTTSADVDVCPTICDFGEGGIFGDEVFESFTQTRANALFINNGTADILLDRYTVSAPGSGIPARTTAVSVLLPGGRCSTRPTIHCGLDSDCGPLGICDHAEVPVEILLYDFVFKTLIIGDAVCPGVDPLTDLPTPGTVVPQTLQTTVIFSGSDESGERFTVTTGLVAGFFDANNCRRVERRSVHPPRRSATHDPGA